MPAPGPEPQPTTPPARAGSRPPSRRAAADVLGGVLIGLVVGALGTAVHLNLAALPGGIVLPWGAALALVLSGASQRAWMTAVADAGGRPVSAGGAVLLGAFTAVVALYLLPAHDRLGLSWDAQTAALAPVALAASVAWAAGVVVVGLVVLVTTAREGARRGE